MGLWDKLTGKAQRDEEAKLAAEAIAEQARKMEEAKKKKSPKDIATSKGEPWVEVLSLDIDEADPSAGSFELDWNDIFVARLIKSGYQGKTDQDIVDNWFKSVCRNVMLETYEQEQADPEIRAATASKRRDLGNGRTEIS